MSKVESIDLIDDSQPDEIILLDDDEENITFEHEVKENELFSKLIQMCLHLSNSKGMNRIFKRMIMPAYKLMDESYSQSERFKKVLSNTIKLIQNDPSQKYCHIKGLYEILKLHRVRKKVQFITLATDIKGKADMPLKRKSDSMYNNSKKPKIDIINLDNYEPSVNIENNISDNLNDSNKTEMENQNLDSTKTIKTMSNQFNHQINCNSSDLLTPEVDCSPNIIENQENKLLIPKFDDIFYDHNHQVYNDFKLLMIEKEMEKYRKRIVELEEQEVVDDKVTSPYVLGEKYKSALVVLYEKWCKLVGKKSIKCNKIRLTVQEGHPPGPVRRLETFLNNNIGSDGCPLFPDFSDVVECVLISNKEDGLLWSKARVMGEATALFTQCGRALQKRRQTLEWQNLVSTVNLENFPKDPADDDPELEARLQENKRIANVKESRILEKFSLMQDLASKNNRVSSESIAQGDSDDSNDHMYDEEIETGNADLPKTNTHTDNNVEVKIKQEQSNVSVVKLLEELGDNYTTTIQDIEDPFLVVEISDSSDED